MTAKFYTYRNLNKGDSFSTKHKGLVVGYHKVSHVQNGEFKVSDAGRARCLATKTRNVHAFVVSDEAPVHISLYDLPPDSKLREVKYNPYVSPTFFLADTKKPIHRADDIYFLGGRAYVISV